MQRHLPERRWHSHLHNSISFSLQLSSSLASSSAISLAICHLSQYSYPSNSLSLCLSHRGAKLGPANQVAPHPRQRLMECISQRPARLRRLQLALRVQSSQNLEAQHVQGQLMQHLQATCRPHLFGMPALWSIGLAVTLLGGDGDAESQWWILTSEVGFVCSTGSRVLWTC